jgi:hypothetical protein
MFYAPIAYHFDELVRCKCVSILFRFSMILCERDIRHKDNSAKDFEFVTNLVIYKYKYWQFLGKLFLCGLWVIDWLLNLQYKSTFF